MKIIYVANARIPTEKAHGIQIMKMCEAFANLGHKVTLLVPKRLNNLKDDPFVYYGVGRNFKIVKLFCLDFVRFGKIGFYIQALTFAKAAVLHALFHKSDLIYGRDEIALGQLSIVKKNVSYEMHTANWNIFHWFLGQFSKNFVVISNGLKKYIEDHGVSSKKIIIAHDAVDLKEFEKLKNKEEIRTEKKLPANAKIVSYIGKYKTMGEEKGLIELLEAFGQLRKEGTEAFLLIVGLNSNELSEVEGLCMGAGISKNDFKLVVHVPRKEAYAYMKASDILVMNYPNTSHYANYMSPLKLFEYMSSGATIISSDLPSIREILNNDNSILIKSNNVNSLRDSIKSVLNDQGLMLKIGRNALVDIKKYSWENRAKTILAQNI